MRYVFSDDEKDRVVKEMLEKAPVKSKKKEAAKKEIEENDENIGEVAAESVSGVNVQRYKGLGEMNSLIYSWVMK